MKLSASEHIEIEMENCNMEINRLKRSFHTIDGLEYIVRQKTAIRFLEGQIRAYESALLYIKSDIDNGGVE